MKKKNSITNQKLCTKTNETEEKFPFITSPNDLAEMCENQHKFNILVKSVCVYLLI